MEEADHAPLPGFRFHPTDEELVRFYLKRKVEKKPTRIELIKQEDIYKYDPWDLPKSTTAVGGINEWYFFCKRGRKYRNSIRPNRVTGSGFWKATGIDKPVYSSGGDFIGLKKSLVFYRGSAGKGTKTDWMMHEFRLPPSPGLNKKTDDSCVDITDQRILQEAEVWTLCRIIKRNASTNRKPSQPGLREMSARKSVNYIPSIDDESNTKKHRVESWDQNEPRNNYICFGAPNSAQNVHPKPFLSQVESAEKQQFFGHLSPPSTAASSSCAGIDEFLRYEDEDWEDIAAAAGGYANPFHL